MRQSGWRPVQKYLCVRVYSFYDVSGIICAVVCAHVRVLRRLSHLRPPPPNPPTYLLCAPCLQVWGALTCGFTSGCFGGLVAGVFEEGEAWITTKCPTWPQQRAFYGVFAYYFLSDPHGSLQYYLRPVLNLVGLGDLAGKMFMSRAGSQVAVIMAMLILEFGLDCEGVDLLAPVNRQLSKAISICAPPRMDRPARIDRLDKDFHGVPPPPPYPRPATTHVFQPGFAATLR